jgi:hypothetical protein
MRSEFYHPNRVFPPPPLIALTPENNSKGKQFCGNRVHSYNNSYTLLPAIYAQDACSEY